MAMKTARPPGRSGVPASGAGAHGAAPPAPGAHGSASASSLPANAAWNGVVWGAATRSPAAAPGAPLDPATRSAAETRLGHDLGAVRVHTDAAADARTAGIGALAATEGRDVYFRSGAYAPRTETGRRVLLHELTHVVQQRPDGGAGARAWQERRVQPAAEREADAVAAPPEGAAALVVARAGSQPRGVYATELPPQPTTCTLPARAAWRTAVQAATTDAARLALVQQAVCDRTVALASPAHPTVIDPADYRPLPVLNFDPLLNQKRTRAGTGSRGGRLLSTNAGYFFTVGTTLYVVLGPSVLREGADDPLKVRLTAHHEIYHSEHHAAGGRGEENDADELETYTNDFVHYFHLFGRAVASGSGRTYLGPQWSTLITYYDRATAPAARQASIQRLVAYYRTPPVAQAERAGVQEAFRLWMQRRAEGTRPAIITALDAELHVLAP